MFQFTFLTGDGIVRFANCKTLILITVLMLFSSVAQAIFHGASMAKACQGPVRVCNSAADCSDGDLCTEEACDTTIPSTISCQIQVVNIDELNDTLMIENAYDIIQAAGGDVRLPASGSLPIISVSGNTTCVPGPFVPCGIGPDIGGGPGRVTFEAEGYEPTPADPDPLPDQGIVTVSDLCDGTPDGNCLPDFAFDIQFSAQTQLVDGCGPGGPPTDCDDANACTDDSCDPATGVCNNIPNFDCDDGDACTDDSCDPFTGLCINTPIPDCNGGECTGDAFCDDGNACTDDSCDLATGLCNNIPNFDCDDSDACTDDSCDPATGLCTNTAGIDCDDGNVCTDDSCDLATGLCNNIPNFDCDDSDACTDDACDPTTGLCVNSPGNDCDDLNACTDDSCDPATGLCTNTPNTDCGPGQPGHGVAIAKVCQGPVRVCDSAADCSDGDECTEDICDTSVPSTIQCQIQIAYFDDFDDTISITDAYDIIQAAGGNVRLPASGSLPIIDVRGNTTCVIGSFVPCEIGPDIGGGSGRVTFEAEGYDVTPADLGLPGGVLIDQGHVNYADNCDGGITPECSFALQTINVSAATTLVDGCQINPGIDCDDGDACTDDACDPATGLCLSFPNYDCDDSNACTDDSCDPITGLCNNFPNFDCDDFDACTDDSCDPATGLCTNTPGIDCDDGNVCTDDSCDPATGLCNNFPNFDCDDSDACTDDSCDPATGTCINTLGTDCDDANACTDDSCDPTTGLCVNSPNYDCEDLDACTDDSCDPATGLCVNTPNYDCDDSDVCTDDSCNPVTGLCESIDTETCNATPPGEDVVVNPTPVDENFEPIVDAPDISFTFEDIEEGGDTTVVVTEFAPESTPPPSGFSITGLNGGPVLYDIESTATLAAGSSFEVCFDYSTMDITGSPFDLRLVHEVGGVWIDITSSIDNISMIICGIADSFSNFAIFASLVIDGPYDPVAVDTEVLLGVDVGDPPIADAVYWQWGDGTDTLVMVTTGGTNETGHTYEDPGVYTVTAILTVGEGENEVEVGSASFQYVVVYDPSAGFVTGGGWFNSPEGAYALDPSLIGKANFGFVSRYKKGAPVPFGNTEFQFKAGDLNFQSSSYEWLVISGARAQFKGTGTINGSGNFGFKLTGVDESLTPSTDVDLFRIKVWDKDNFDLVVYDNGLSESDDSDPTTAIDGGSIVVHKAKSKKN